MLKNIAKQLLRLFYLLQISFILVGCAVVKTENISFSTAVSNQRNDILNSKQFSYNSLAVLQVIGMDSKSCIVQFSNCINKLIVNEIISDEEKYSTLAELWLANGLKRIDDVKNAKNTLNIKDIDSFLNSLRYSYAYLFLNDKDVSSFEYRRSQIRDYYNFNIRVISDVLFKYWKDKYYDREVLNFNFNVDGWHISVNTERLDIFTKQTSYDLVDATQISFKGIRNVYRRDGVGAEMVLIPLKTAEQFIKETNKGKAQYKDNPYIAITVLAMFEMLTKDNVHDLKQLKLEIYNPYITEEVEVNNSQIPIAANFTASYGLWLSQSSFAWQSISRLFNRSGLKHEPIVYLMQSYDPNKKIVLLIHGLASSPEAWVNLANDIVGDKQLRKNYQIWQLYYPTNYPIAINHQQIRKSLKETFTYVTGDKNKEFDNQIVVIGHSMGGVIAKLLVSGSNKQQLVQFLDQYKQNNNRVKAQKQMNKLFNFEPMKSIERVIFLATPHFGTNYDTNKLSLWLAQKISISKSDRRIIKDINSFFRANNSMFLNTRNSIDSLSNRDPLTRYAQTLAIKGDLPYHSIIGNKNNTKLEDSDDGLVPWTSSYISGAQSDYVINAYHNLQNKPETIMEIRRILHLNLNSFNKK